MINEDILCVGDYVADEWQQELEGLQSAWPGRLRKVRRGQEALALLKQKSLACIVVFPGLADFHGLEFLLRLRTVAPDIPIVIVVLVPERSQDGVVGGKDHVWLYQKSPQRTSHLPCVVKKIISAQASEGEERE